MKVIKLEVVNSIKVGPNSTVLDDGTIVNPAPFIGVNVLLDDGSRVQIEGDPATLTKEKITLALSKRPRVKLGEVFEGDLITVISGTV